MNASLFKYFVARAGYTLADVAERLEINYSTLFRKISGETDFTRREMVILRDYLNLTLDELEKIFFTENLA